MKSLINLSMVAALTVLPVFAYSKQHCGQPEDPIMIEFENVNDFTQRGMVTYQVYKNGVYSNSGNAAMFGISNVRSTEHGKMQIIDTAIRVQDELNFVKVIVSNDNQVSLRFLDSELVCVEYNSSNASQNTTTANR